jgi:hypothetical protein
MAQEDLLSIAFFGDSFCSVKDHKEYNTYIYKLEKYFDAKVNHLGYSGSSIWDCWINQYNFITNKHIPDIMVFVWTEHNRLFDKKYRKICSSVVDRKILNSVVNNAATQYYQYFYDEEKSILEYKSALYYFDNIVLSQIQNKTKIIHLWSFGDFDFKSNNVSEADINYFYDWKHGMELRPPMIKFGMDGFDWKNYCLHSESCPNHIFGEDRNQKIFEFIKFAIENYQPGEKINYYDIFSK